MKLDSKSYFINMFRYTDSSGKTWKPVAAYCRPFTTEIERFDIVDNTSAIYIAYSSKYMYSDDGYEPYAEKELLISDKIRSELLVALQEFFSPWGKEYHFSHLRVF